ncbi:MAG: hypothetical protein JSS53_01080 [Proteobacteria bacterium]|nr:hypothetical protein [Pseudomonadota bacterium]
MSGQNKKQNDKSNIQVGFFKSEKKAEYSFSKAFMDEMENGILDIKEAFNDGVGYVEEAYNNVAKVSQ